MFGTIWRDLKKTIKSLTINSTKIVYQVLDEPQELKDDLKNLLKTAGKNEQVTFLFSDTQIVKE